MKHSHITLLLAGAALSFGTTARLDAGTSEITATPTGGSAIDAMDSGAITESGAWDNEGIFNRNDRNTLARVVRVQGQMLLKSEDGSLTYAVTKGMYIPKVWLANGLFQLLPDFDHGNGADYAWLVDLETRQVFVTSGPEGLSASLFADALKKEIFTPTIGEGVISEVTTTVRSEVGRQATQSVETTAQTSSSEEVSPTDGTFLGEALYVDDGRGGITLTDSAGTGLESLAVEKSYPVTDENGVIQMVTIRFITAVCREIYNSETITKRESFSEETPISTTTIRSIETTTTITRSFGLKDDGTYGIIETPNVSSRDLPNEVIRRVGETFEVPGSRVVLDEVTNTKPVPEGAGAVATVVEYLTPLTGLNKAKVTPEAPGRDVPAGFCVNRIDGETHSALKALGE